MIFKGKYRGESCNFQEKCLKYTELTIKPKIKKQKKILNFKKTTKIKKNHLFLMKPRIFLNFLPRTFIPGLNYVEEEHIDICWQNL